MGNFSLIRVFEPLVKLGENGIFEGPVLKEKWLDHKENSLPDFIEKQLEFPELVLERPASVYLTPEEFFQMFQNKTRDPQDPNESWISPYIEYYPIEWISEELKKEISEPGFEKDFFTQLKLKQTYIWIGKSYNPEVVTSILETTCVGNNFKILVTVSAILVTNIDYLFRLASGTNIQKMSPTSKFSHQIQVTNITVTVHIIISGDGQTLGKLHYDRYENALAVVKGAKEVILFYPRNNQQLYETFIQQARFEVNKNNGSYELVRRGLQERNCFK